MASHPVLMAPERYLTAYKYLNDEVPRQYREGVLYYDSGNGQVMFLCAGESTPWHGELRKTGLFHGDQMTIRFDAKSRTDRPPKLKAVCLFPVANETYEGFDYRGRFVRMRPLTKWKCQVLGPDGSLAWQRYSEWTCETNEWVYIES